MDHSQRVDQETQNRDCQTGIATVRIRRTAVMRVMVT